ncbi:MAG: TCR/Tet family MFS transporter [Gammaproteobacteria bacterium]|nr:TCR/Tet family MFS transporter [Gammaproteobacteria bacterium]
MIELQQKKHATRFVLFTVFSYAVSFGIIMPVLPSLIVELEKVSLSEAAFLGGMVAAAYAVFQFLMGPLVGNLGDRFGRRPVFLFSLAGFSIDFFFMGFAQNIWWLFIGRSIAGGLGAIFGPANAAMSDISSPEDRAKSFGMVGASFGIGFVVGPALGGLLADFGTRTPFFFAAGISALVFVYGYFFFPETMSEGSRRAFSIKRANPIGAFVNLKKLKGVTGIAFIYLIWVTSTNVYPVTWPYYVQIQYQWSTKMVGISLALVGISMALIQALVIGRVVSKVGERNTAMIGLIFAMIGMLFYAFNTSGELAMGLCLFVGVQGMVMPSINAMMSRRTPKNSQGELQGFNGSLAALAALLAPLIYNTSLSYFTSPNSDLFFPGIPFLISGLVAACALIGLRMVSPVNNNDIKNSD